MISANEAMLGYVLEVFGTLDWMQREGFANEYTFGYVMEHMQDFIDAYEKEKRNGTKL